MLLKLIRIHTTRFSHYSTLYESDSVLGDKRLADIIEPLPSARPELFYPLTVTRSGINIQGKPVTWRWPDEDTKNRIITSLRTVQQTHEEIRIELTHYEPEFPGYPHTDFNAYARRDSISAEEVFFTDEA